MPNFRCPVCKKPLTKTEYEAALKLTQEQHKHHQEELKTAKKEGMETERTRTARLAARLKIANQRIRQLERGKTPQTAGLDDQHKLAARLAREFEPQGDQVIEKGQGGDVLHIVMHNKEVAGKI